MSDVFPGSPVNVLLEGLLDLGNVLLDKIGYESTSAADVAAADASEGRATKYQVPGEQHR